MPPVRKCLVWDLDDTLWDGTYLEGAVTVRPEARRAIEELDRRGILHSIASRGEEEPARDVLRAEGLLDFFLVPHINWDPKPKNIIAISRALDISLDSIMFIDNDRFEREQVTYMLPEVMVIDASLLAALIDHPSLRVAHVTEEARRRRDFYAAEQQRELAGRDYPDRRTFLESCAMKLILRPMTPGDLPRVLELMSRTHQLNTVGRMLDQSELSSILRDRGLFSVMVAELSDRFGGYGTVGTAIVESDASLWKLRYLAVSCRVLGRGVERAILSALLQDAARRGLSQAEAAYRDTGRNRAMLALYQIMGFRRSNGCEEDGTAVFSRTLDGAPAVPSWIEVS
ncbi:MAG TPA: HAD-IIIC family phosphatase [Spirochaetia bacterium]|nr:HAD-IIIC family phosphatase [Spirochaetia bacterium]